MRTTAQRLVLAVLTAGALVASAPVSAHGHVVYLGKNSEARIAKTCGTVLYTVVNFRDYAAKVFKRERIGKTAHHRIWLMHVCQHSFQARKAVGKIHERLKRDRKEWMCSNWQPLNCIRDASKKYGVSYDWLVACANSEGGTGPSDYDKMNYEGSGAGGNFQFMYGTFVDAVRRMGHRWSYKATRSRWLTSKWNSLAAAWKFKHDGTGEWTGAGC